MKEKYDYSISITRVIAMVFIVICHMASLFGKNAIATLFDVGVPIFFIISGYLASFKIIENEGKWIIKKIIRIYVPLVIWLVSYLAITLIKGDPFASPIQLLMLITNMQGLNHFISYIPLGIGPWFFTVILLCYYFFLILCRLEAKYHVVYTPAFLFTFFIVLCVFGLLKINVSGFFAFYIGAYLGKQDRIVAKIESKPVLVLGMALSSVVIRLLTKFFIDDTVVYEFVVVSITHIVLALSVFFIVRCAFVYFPKLMNRIGHARVIRSLDEMSIYVYMSHTWFLGSLIVNVFSLKIPFILELTLYVALVLLTCTILCILGKKITERINASFSSRGVL